jgi:hypothetical protein
MLFFSFAFFVCTPVLIAVSAGVPASVANCPNAFASACLGYIGFFVRPLLGVGFLYSIGGAINI